MDRLLGRDGYRLLLNTDILYFSLALLASFLTETLNSGNQKNLIKLNSFCEQSAQSCT